LSRFSDQAHTLLSTEVLMLLPELRPGKLWASADKNVWMVLAFFVPDALWVAIVPSQAAACEDSVNIFARVANDD